MECESEVTLPSLADYTLVVSCVSVGNVGQLAMDVILTTLQRAGQLIPVTQVDHPALIPMVGADPITNTNSLTCAMQLYTSDQHRLALLQVRSGLVPGSSSVFSADLVSWSAHLGVKRIVCLTSSFAHERQESQLSGPGFRILTTDGVVDVPDTFQRLEPRHSLHGLPVDTGHQEVFLPGSGVAVDLYHHCQSGSAELVVLSKFCEEGDNTGDGLGLADYSNALLHWSGDHKYQVPQSWSSLFGSPAPAEMFW